MKLMITSIVMTFAVMATLSIHQVRINPSKLQHQVPKWNDTVPNTKTVRQIVIWNQ
jgi:hypothetical protein